jgi:hypothetical protein
MALQDALSRPATMLGEMGARGRAWMARDFSWDAVGTRMIEVYDWLDGKAPRPDCVHLD